MLSLDLDPVAFYLPYLHHPVTWYGILFSLGILISLWQGQQLLKKRAAFLGYADELFEIQLSAWVDRFLTYAIFGILFGARLIEALVYNPHLLQSLAFFKIWEGGLASHGGLLGLISATYLFWRHNHQDEVCKKTDLCLGRLADLIAIVSGPTAAMIRIGNFINQELIGLACSAPWAVTFMRVDGPQGMARHPVQLYEATAYILIWIWACWRSKRSLRTGKVACETLIFIFTARFLLEWFKEPVSYQDHLPVLTLGQYLSLPVIISCLLIRVCLNRYPRQSKYL